MYDDSIIVLYGDHYGISENIIVQWHSFRKDQITEFDTLNLQRTPLYIHMPGQTEGETISKPTGQIDIKPTILNLLGIDTTNDIRFGHDMFSDEYTGFVVLRDGSFVTDKYAYKNNTFYDRITGEIVDLPKEAQALIKRAQNELRMSDKIIEGDLLRFSESNKIKTGEVQTKIKETEK